MKADAPNPGEMFLYWKSSDNRSSPNPLEAENAMFRMVDRDVTLTAVFGTEHTHADGNNDGSCDECGFHKPTPRTTWSHDDTHHWKKCLYCDDATHFSSKTTHYFTRGVCLCGYRKDSTLKITEQPEDVRNVYVSNANEDYDDNIATFRVTATGGSGTLTYQWYSIPRSGGTPRALEGETNAVLALVIATDACYNPYDYYCVITDGEGNTVQSDLAGLFAMHDIRYWSNAESEIPCDASKRTAEGHILGCVGESCEMHTALQPHADADENGCCDVCGYHEHHNKGVWFYDVGSHYQKCYLCKESLNRARHSLVDGKCTVCGYDSASTIRISEQPKDVNAVVSNADEDYENNTATFSVTAVGGSGDLSYQWYEISPSKGSPYKLTETIGAEGFDSATLKMIVPTDACYEGREYYCVITDEDGHTLNSNTAKLIAAHDFRYWSNKERGWTCDASKSSAEGHILGCVGEGCEAHTALQHHADTDNDGCCDVCDYAMTTPPTPPPPHTHSFDTAWKNDKDNHWHECACGEKSDKAEHIYTDAADTDCDICGYERTLAMYSVTVDTNGHGSASASPATAVAGTTITLTATADRGYHFREWMVTSGEIAIVDNAFVMPDSDVVVKAIFEKNGPGGSVVPPIVYIPPFLPSDYPVKDDEPTIPDEPVIPDVPVIPAEPAVPVLPFTDVDKSMWSYEDIVYVYEHALMNGTSASVFAPKMTTSRAMIVTILYRLEGEPAVFGTSSFSDVTGNTWYSDAILWGEQNEIVKGYDNGKFGVDDNITREQLATILYRYARFKGMDAVTTADYLSSFSDHEQVSGYAVTSMNWAVGSGLIGGADNKLMPTDGATREQLAAVLHRFCENVLK